MHSDPCGPSLISLMVSMDVKHLVYLLYYDPVLSRTTSGNTEWTRTESELKKKKKKKKSRSMDSVEEDYN